jgi:3,4-dihydroxy 2-butanone 4-phosphate synthase/GTP cyclohydrolase II
VKGDLRAPGPVMVRMHRLSVFRDLLGDTRDSHVGELQASMRMIGKEGRGVIVLIREPWVSSLSDSMRTPPGRDEQTHGHDPALRDYGVGAQILIDLGVQDMILLTNSSRTIVGLEGYGLRVLERRPIPVGEP